jgi:23S rRNA (cytidine1920-2'-O)/16S rRNA (cytidine1409-2'-O)-methyltransferase
LTVADSGNIPLDIRMVQLGHALDQAAARALIMAGQVVVDDHLVDKPGTLVGPDARVRLKNVPGRYVSRGGDKLAGALATLQISVANKAVLDVGASTGGFTDCLLQHGAAVVFAVDVGYGQLAWKLRNDRRVVVLERTNIRVLKAHLLQPAPDCAVIDASFVSLKGILPAVAALLPAGASILALVKPQFEVAPGGLERGGIVRSEKQYQVVFERLFSRVRELGMQVRGIVESPITGQKGNREFFLYVCLP